MLENRDNSSYILYAALELRAHGLPREADSLVAQLEEVVDDLTAVDTLVEQTSRDFLQYFTV